MYEYEFEFEGEGEFEFEGELEGEYEGEFEAEMEGEEFFGRIASLARRVARIPALRSIGLQAARAAMGSLSRSGGLGGLVGNVVGGMLPPSDFGGEGEFEFEFEGEGEYEFEFEGEFESFSNPQKRLETEALMAHLGNAAASAESEEEAEAFLGALIPLAAQLVPRVAPMVMRAAPQLINGVANAARTLMNSPATQQLVRTLPTIAKNTVGSIARQVANGQPVTVQSAVRTLARQTANVIGQPQQAVKAYRQNQALDRAHHRQAPKPTAPINRAPAPPRRTQPRTGAVSAKPFSGVSGGASGAVHRRPTRPAQRPTPHRPAPDRGAPRGGGGARGRCAGCR
jgi:hypothetical protein